MGLTFERLLILLLAGALLVTAGRLGVVIRRMRLVDTVELPGLRHEVTRLEHGHAELERLSVTDPLTGVWNYRYLQLVLDREVMRAGRFTRPLGLLLLDLDHFRDVNERHGHQGAGAVLREVAQRVALEIRQVDTLARYGGEEFVVLLPETDAAGAVRVAERLCYAVRRASFGAPGDPVRLTVSVGVAVLPGDGTHATTLLRAADHALARAKREGGDRVCGGGGTAGPRPRAGTGPSHPPEPWSPEPWSPLGPAGRAGPAPRRPDGPESKPQPQPQPQPEAEPEPEPGREPEHGVSINGHPHPPGDLTR